MLCSSRATSSDYYYCVAKHLKPRWFETYCSLLKGTVVRYSTKCEWEKCHMRNNALIRERRGDGSAMKQWETEHLQICCAISAAPSRKNMVETRGAPRGENSVSQLIKETLFVLLSISLNLLLFVFQCCSFSVCWGNLSIHSTNLGRDAASPLYSHLLDYSHSRLKR